MSSSGSPWRRALPLQAGAVLVLVSATLGYGWWRLGQAQFTPGPRVALLQGKLDHYSIQSLSAHHKRLDRYTTLAAEELYSHSVKVSLLDLLLRPPLAFLRSYIFRFGFLDGLAGILIAYFAAYYVFLKYAKAWELKSGFGEH